MSGRSGDSELVPELGDPTELRIVAAQSVRIRILEPGVDAADRLPERNQEARP
jgi:hypothetical protein